MANVCRMTVYLSNPERKTATLFDELESEM